MLYPLKFNTIYKDKIWGGNKIKTILHKEFSPLPNCGETWEISGVKDNVSVIVNGALAGTNLIDLITQFKQDLVGSQVYQKFGNEFPLLVKFIDANDDLSIQVHPNDELAFKRHHSFGKTEMWYILQADNGAKLNTGFNKPMDKSEYIAHLNSKTLTQILNYESVKEGDVFFLPAGRVHYIGKGILLAEIQQTSDITYRLYDFDRMDSHGNKRELHTDEALDAIDFKYYGNYKTESHTEMNKVENVVSSPYFDTNVLKFNTSLERDFTEIDSFVILICTKGKLQLSYNGFTIDLALGETLLVPATIKKWNLTPLEQSVLIETYVP